MFKNILITGGAGYIGSHTARAFLEKGYGVTIVDDLSAGYLEAVPEGAGFVKSNIFDVREIVDIILKNDIEGVVHFAAHMNVPESIKHPLNYYSNNTGGVMSVLRACLITDVKKFVLSSSADVYGNAKANLITEDFPISPINPFAFSNYFSERILGDCGRAYGIDNVILRYFNAAGAAQDTANGQRSKGRPNLIKLAAETALGITPSLKIEGTGLETNDGTAIRDYIHVEDLADLHTLAFEYLENGGASDIFNCGYGRGHSAWEIVNTMKRVSGVDFNVVEENRIPDVASTLVVNNDKIKKTFNWGPKRNDLELICRSTLDWEITWQKKLKELKQKKLKLKNSDLSIEASGVF